MLPQMTGLPHSLPLVRSPTDEPKIAPDVERALENLPSGQRLAVIVTFEQQADLRHIQGADRGERLLRLITTLQQTARDTQRSYRLILQDLGRTSQVNQVTFFWIFNGLSMTATPEVIAQFASRPDVRAITLDRSFPAPALSSTPSRSLLSESEPNLVLTNAPALWDLGFEGQGIVVASMDSGVSGSHPDLVDQWRGGTNSWFDPYGEHPSTPVDLSGHGTATMGVMVGRDAGGTAIGVAPQAQWIAVKIFNDAGGATTSAIHQGFQWLLDPDGDPLTPDVPHVVNNSWSIGNTDCDLAFQLDLQALRAAGIVPVFAAGNSGPGDATSVSPANNPEAFAVGATDNADQIYVESAHGPSACGEPATIYPEMVAPGVDIRAADRYATYQTASGTSLAAPHVAGALALLLSAYPNLTAVQQEAALLNGAVDLGPWGPDNVYGWGRLDVLAAYNWLMGTTQLSISKRASHEPVSPGTMLTYTLVITNTGPHAATAVTVTDELPPGVTYGGAGGEGWSCGHSGAVVTCTRPALALGVAPTIALTVTVPETVGLITNTARVASGTYDPESADDVDLERTAVGYPEADLAIAKYDSADPVLSGGTLTYTLVVTNAGPQSAGVVTVTDTLPPSFKVDSISGKDWSCNHNPGTVRCTRSSLPVGEAPHIVVKGTAPVSASTMMNSVVISSTTKDPDSANNAASEGTVVALPPVQQADLSIVKLDHPDPVHVGAVLTYTLGIGNNGPDPATSVTMTDTLPAGVTYRGASGAGWDCRYAGQEVACSLPHLDIGLAPSLMLTVDAPDSSGIITNTVTVSSYEVDLDPRNNTATADTRVRSDYYIFLPVALK
jgi:uncharacterized repeat protein (TIGR01451 family)